MIRKRDYKENMFKVYAEIWDRCNKAMQGKLEARTDYKSTIYNDPIELLRAVKKHTKLLGIKIRNEYHNRRIPCIL